MKCKNRMMLKVLASFLLCGAFIINGEDKSPNLVKNPGCEEGEGELPMKYGIGYWSMQKEGGSEGSVKFTSENACSGKKSLLIEHTNGQGFIHPSQALTIEPGLYIYRLRAKSDAPVKFSMQLLDERKWKVCLNETLSIRGCGEWTIFEFALPKITEKLPASIQIGLREKGRLFLDDIEIVSCSESEINSRMKNAEKKDAIAAEPAANAPAIGIKIEDTAAFLKVSNGMICVSAVKTPGKKIAVSCFLKNAEIPAAEIEIFSGNNEKICPASLHAEKQETGEALMSIKLQDGKELVLNMFASNEYMSFTGKGFVGKLVISHRSKAAIIPDLAGEDFVVYPESAPDRINIPSDNFYFVNLLDGRNAMLSFLWKNEEIKIQAGKNTSDSDCFNRTEISLVPWEPVWLGLNAGENIWWKAAGNKSFEDPVEIGWAPPFPAQWAVLYKVKTGIFPEESGVTDRWFLYEKSRDKIPLGIGLWDTRASIFRGGDITDGKTVIEYPKTRNTEYKRSYDPTFPPVIYPFNSVSETPAGITFPLPAVKTLLGDETYGKIICIPSRINLPLPGQQRFLLATCGTTENIEKIFYRGGEKKERKEIDKNIDGINIFVSACRARIEEYMEWRKKIDAVLASEESKNKKISETAAGFRKDLSRIEQLYTSLIEIIKTPEHCFALSQKYLELIDKEMDEEQKEEECKNIGRDIRRIGGRQDLILAKSRRIIKALRNKATGLYVFSSDEQTKRLAALIRQETFPILRERAVGHEGK